MELTGVFDLLKRSAPYGKLVEALSDTPAGTHVPLPPSAKPFLLACLWRHLDRPLLVLVPRPQQARQLHEQLLTWLQSESPTATPSLYLYPEPDSLPYERIASDPASVLQRLQVLFTLRQPKSTPLIVASVAAASPKTLPRQAFDSSCLNIATGTHLSMEVLLSHLASLGYVLESGVEVPGTASRRGGIIDLFPPQMSLPARLEFSGDRVESIRLFDPSSQRSHQEVEAVRIMPTRELLLPTGPEAHSLLEPLDFSRCPPEVKESFQQETERLARGMPSPDQELLAPLLERGSLLDYLPSGTLLTLDQPDQVEAAMEDLDSRAQELYQGQVTRGELPQNLPRPYFTWRELEARRGDHSGDLIIDAWGSQEEPQAGLGFRPAPAFGGQLPELVEWLQEERREKHTLVLVSQQAQRLSELLLEQDILTVPQTELKEPPAPGSLTLLQWSLQQGWALEKVVSQHQALVLLTDAELFGLFKQRRSVTRRPVKRESFLTDLRPGDYVVHLDHGVACFAGVVRRATNGIEQEYLLLEYAGSDRLYVPVEHLDRVGRYVSPRGPDAQPPPLSRLGSQEWERTKKRVKESARQMAKELLELYAARQIVPGHAFSADTPWQQELELAFPYVETPDQLQAIAEVKADMESPRPMDRLICGDVGYGKTEVALRAAFKAVMDGFQVAVLVPTTVLAQQHLETFRQRMAPFPVRVEALSRFLSSKEQTEVLNVLARGRVDITIGTHRLLQKDVQFKNLGLVVIDEEQRFGVAHKERLKEMRKEVDMLTMSATPIPRTLYLSLSGVRDMSTMSTPPEERLPISTYVGSYDERLIPQAILRELERGGQVFFVHNRVQTIQAVAEQVRRMVPEAEVVVAHGQMPEEELEEVMAAFAGGQGDVLVCTTIIESGLDMPNANTLLIHEADKFGLAQLYQLRGRVGRGTNRAFAYLFFPRYRRPTDIAERRLETLLSVTSSLDGGSLGAGFRIAIKDLEIRGAGNLLGSEQSGYMAAVGYDLYCRLLNEATEEAKARQEGRPLPTPKSEVQGPTIDLPLSAYLPADYVEDTGLRLALYQRLVGITSPDEVDDFQQELRDRFGPLPPPAQDLLYVVTVKALASKVGALVILAETQQLVIRFPDRQALLAKGPILERQLGRFLRVGNTQLRLDFQANWQQLLLETLQVMASPRG